MSFSWSYSRVMQTYNREKLSALVVGINFALSVLPLLVSNSSALLGKSTELRITSREGSVNKDVWHLLPIWYISMSRKDNGTVYLRARLNRQIFMVNRLIGSALAAFNLLWVIIEIWLICWDWGKGEISAASVFLFVFIFYYWHKLIIKTSTNSNTLNEICEKIF